MMCRLFVKQLMHCGGCLDFTRVAQCYQCINISQKNVYMIYISAIAIHFQHYININLRPGPHYGADSYKVTVTLYFRQKIYS